MITMILQRRCIFLKIGFADALVIFSIFYTKDNEQIFSAFRLEYGCCCNSVTITNDP